jgi:hypothetical protein
MTPTKNAAAKACSGAWRVQRVTVSNGMPGSRTAPIASLTRRLADRNASAAWSAADLIGSPDARGRARIRESIAFNLSSSSPMSDSLNALLFCARYIWCIDPAAPIRRRHFHQPLPPVPPKSPSLGAIGLAFGLVSTRSS